MHEQQGFHSTPCRQDSKRSNHYWVLSYREHLLREAAGLILKHLPGGEAGRPDALEHLHNAAALVGAACGNVLETLDPAAPLWPAETDADGARIAVLARDLGFPDAAALRAACEALR